MHETDYEKYGRVMFWTTFVMGTATVAGMLAMAGLI